MLGFNFSPVADSIISFLFASHLHEWKDCVPFLFRVICWKASNS